MSNNFCNVAMVHKSNLACATKYLETKIWYKVNNLGVGHNKTKALQRLPMDRQA
jgi:hypothetical protein